MAHRLEPFDIKVIHKLRVLVHLEITRKAYKSGIRRNDTTRIVILSEAKDDVKKNSPPLRLGNGGDCFV